MPRIATRPLTHSLFLDGVGDEVDFGNNFDKALADSFSVSGWVRQTSRSSFSYLMNKMATSGSLLGWHTRLDSGKFVFSLANGASIISKTTALTLNLNEWYFVTATYNGSNDISGIKLYINGVLQSTTNSGTSVSSEITNSESMVFGGRADNGAFRFVGNATDWRVHDAELTAAQVASLYYDDSAASVQGHWRFTDGSGATLTAQVGGVNGTITGAAWSTDVPTKLPTAISTKRFALANRPKFSLSYDGTSDYVDFGNNFAFERTDAFSFSFWIKSSNDTATTMLNKRTGAGTGYRLNLQATRLFQWVAEGSNGNFMVVDANVQLPKNQWTHVVMTYSGSSLASGVKFYFNGSQITDTDTTNNLTASIVTSDSFRLGANESGSGSLTGFLTNFRVHNAELTSDQVMELYRDAKAVSVLGEWDFNTGSGTTLTATVGAVNGTINGTTWSTDVPVPARTAISSYRVPLDFHNLGVTALYDFRTGYENLDSRCVADMMGGLMAQWKGGTAIGSIYTTGEYQADFELSSADYFQTSVAKFPVSSITELTAFAWIKRESLTALQPAIGQWLTTGNQRAWEIYANSDGTLNFAFSQNGSSSNVHTSDSAVLNNTDWHFVSVSFTASGLSAMYLDGVAIPCSLSAGGNVAQIFVASAPIEIGGRSSASLYFDGLIGICGFAVARTMSAAEHAHLYQLTNNLGGYR